MFRSPDWKEIENQSDEPKAGTSKEDNQNGTETNGHDSNHKKPMTCHQGSNYELVSNLTVATFGHCVCASEAMIGVYRVTQVKPDFLI